MKGQYYNAFGQEISFFTDVIQPHRITSFVGGGGKTSSMLALGWELCGQKYKNSKVIMTTTTRILPFPDHMLAPGLFCQAVPMTEGKLGPVDNPDGLADQCDYLLIEADGSRGLPLKVPKDHEPVLTEGTGLVIAVMGLSGIGKRIKDVCHRPELVCKLLGKTMEDSIEVQDAITILLSPKGLRKDVGNRSYAVILNQADGEKERLTGVKIAAGLPRDMPCILSSYPSKIS